MAHPLRCSTTDYAYRRCRPRDRAVASTSASRPTTSIAAGASIGGRGPSASPPSSPPSTPTSWRCRRSIGPGLRRARSRRSARRGARHGLGHGADARASASSVRQCRPQPVPDPRSRAARPVLEDVRAALQPARRDRSRRGPRLLHVYNVHLGTALLERRYQATRLATWMHDRRSRGPKLVLGDFNEWSRGLATDMLGASGCRASTSIAHLKRRRTYPGFFPVLHLDHIYFDGDIEIRRIELPRTRLALVASDHLPLVADVRVRFVRSLERQFSFVDPAVDWRRRGRVGRPQRFTVVVERADRRHGSAPCTSRTCAPRRR